MKILVSLLFLIGYGELLGQESKEYFEGEVHLKISCIALYSRILQQTLEEEIGDSLIGKVKHDKYLMYQNSNGQLGKTKIIFLLDEGVGYEIFEKSDTIYKFSLLDNPNELLSVDQNMDDRKEILGDTCNAVTIKYKPKENYGIIEYVEAKYFFNTKFKLDKEKYNNHNNSYWNKFINRSGSISVRNEILTYPLYGTIYEATKIIEKEISDEEFELDPDMVVVERKK